MLQKIKKSYLTDLLFFIILFIGLWALYRSRAFLLSRLLGKLTHTEFKIDQVTAHGPFNLNIYNVRSSFITIDTLSISASPLELIRFRLQFLQIKGLDLYVDSLPLPSEKQKNTSQQGEFRLPELPFFLAALSVQNITIHNKGDAYHINDLRIDFKGTTRNFFARFSLEEARIKDFRLEFIKANIYRIGNSIKIANGELCSNVLCMERISAGYDSLITATFSGISFKNTNLVIENAQIATSPLLKYGKVKLYGIESHDRMLKLGKITFNREGRTLKYSFEITSDWLKTEGNGRMNYKGPLSYSIHFSRILYEEKDAHIRGKLFVNGLENRLKGILRVDAATYRNKNLGRLTAFFKLQGFSVLNLDSVFITNKSSITEVSGLLTPDSQFLYILPDIYVEDYDTSMAGHITGEIAAMVLKNRKILPNVHLDIDDLKSSYADIENTHITIRSISEDSLDFRVMGENIALNRGLSLDTFSMEGILTNLSVMSYVLSVKRDKEWLYLVGDAFRGFSEYTIDIDTVYGMINNMHVFSERALFASYKRGTFYLTTGNLYLEKGRIRIQGTFNKQNGINLILQADSLELPYKKAPVLTLTTTTQLTGSLENPVFVSRGEIYNPVFRGISAQSIVYSVSFVKQVLSIEYLKILRAGGFMTAHGSIKFPARLYPISGYDSIFPDIDVKFERFDITPLFYFIRDVYSIEYAEIDGQINIKSSFKEPFISGGLLFKGQNGYLPAVGIRTDNIRGYIQFAGNKIVLKSLRGESDAGQIIAFGTIKSTNTLFDNPDITISARDVYLEIGPEIQALCDADLFLKKGEQTPLLMEGDVKVKEGYLYAEFSAPRSASREESNPVMALNLSISWDENVYLINEIAEIEFSGKLSYLYDRAGMLINGNLTVLGGNFSYFDRLFKVDGGKVQFNNLSRIDPALNISAITDVDSYTIRLNISGTLTEPVINLSSEPPLDEGNILALLTFGKLLSETEAGIISANLLEKKALGFAQSYLLRNIRRRLGLRELEVSSGSLEEDPHLTVGFYVTRDIYLKYYHDFLSVQYDRFDLRYRISRYFGLNATRDEDGRYYFGVFFEKRF